MRVGSGIENSAQFAAFRESFRQAATTVSASPQAVSVGLTAREVPLEVRATAPFTTAAQTTPAPPTLTLGVDGVDLGRKILSRSPIIQKYRQTHGHQKVTLVVGQEGVTEWEAEDGAIYLPFESAHDPTASGNTYLWAPEPEGAILGSDYGGVTYRLTIKCAGSYQISARILTPSPEDVSFYIEIFKADGTTLLPRINWSTGVFKAWTWSYVKASGSKEITTVALPQGEVILAVRPREHGSKIDKLRLIPANRS